MIIKYNKRMVKNLGNYENITLDIGIEKTIDFEEGETLEDVYLEIRTYVNNKLKSEFSKIEKEQLKKRNKNESKL
jgi:hypothetical protein